MLIDSKYILFLLLGIFSLVNAQIIPQKEFNQNRNLREINNDSILTKNKSKSPADSLKIYNPKIGDYNFWTSTLPKQSIDTALTIDSFYKQNVYQKDLFAFQQFPNLGQTLQPLEPVSSSSVPQLLPLGKSFMYVKEGDVKYYDVKTPVTEFIFENGVQEGQYLSTTFTQNLHSRLNYAINYRYLKSQGNYLNSLSRNSNFIFSSNYRTKNKRYSVRGNFVANDLNNQENGGLTEQSLYDYITNNPNFSNRERMYINLNSAQSKYDERRFHLDHQFGLFSLRKRNDSLRNIDSLDNKTYPFYLNHSLDYKHQAFEYEEIAVENYYTSEVLEGARDNRKKFDVLENRLSLGFKWSDKLDVEGGLIQQSMKLYYDQSQTVGSIVIPESTKENRIGVQGKLKFDWRKNIQFNADASFTKGDIFGNSYNFNFKTRIIPFKDYLLEGGVVLNGSYPAINFYNNQSFYSGFNYNNENFDNETDQTLYATIKSEKIGLSIFGSLININNYVYVDKDFIPKQTDEPVKYFKLGAREHYRYNKFGLDVEAQYQKVVENEGLLPLPKVLARATFYYDTWAFKGHAHIQTGLTSSYYTKFNARSFFPVLNEFMLSNNNREIGNYPKTDLFFNIKVDRMRIYLRGENINSFFQKGEYFATPIQPARDFKIQIGIHWYLFS